MSLCKLGKEAPTSRTEDDGHKNGVITPEKPVTVYRQPPPEALVHHHMLATATTIQVVQASKMYENKRSKSSASRMPKSAETDF